MSKILSLDFRKGTTKNSISGNLGTNIGTFNYKNTDKGNAMYGDTAGSIGLSYSGTPDFGDSSLVVAFRKNEKATYHNLICATNTAGQRMQIYIHQSSGQIFGFSNGSYGITAETYKDNQRHLAILVEKGGVRKLYVDNVEVSFLGITGVSSQAPNKILIGDGPTTNGMSGYIGYKAELYDHALSETERSSIYKEYLQSKQLTTQTKDFTYHKPTRLDEEGLVCAYNMIPSPGNVLTDISGNGNNGTINGPLSTLDGMAFGDGYIVASDSNLPTGDSERTINLILKLQSDKTTVLFEYGTVATGQRFSVYYSSGKLYTAIGDGANSHTFAYNTNFHTLSVVIPESGTICSDVLLYVDGELLTKATSSTVVINTALGGNLYLGSNIVLSALGNIELNDFKLYNKEFSLQQIKDYHNNRASQVSLLEDFRYAKADGTNVLPLGWIPGTGSYKISENGGLDWNSKALECSSNGTIEKQSSQAYGTWEFEIDSENGISPLYFISDTVAGSYNSYQIRIDSSLRVGLAEFTTGALTHLFYTSTAYVQKNTTYGIKITRTTDGIFTVYIKGGSFGNAYVLVDTIGGVGSNPVTDNTHTTSKFSVLDFDVGDKISNIKYTKGIIV